MHIFTKMTGIQIDLSEKKIQNGMIQAKGDLSKWLSSKPYTIEEIESEINKTGNNLDNILKGIALMEIETDTAIDYARKGEINTTAHIFAKAKETKDFIYESLMIAYGIINEEERNLDLNLLGIGKMQMWGDYVKEKYDAKIRQCEFIMENRRFY